MQAINLLALTEKVDSEWMPLYERSLSARDKEQRIRAEEIETIDLFVKKLPKSCVSELNHWFYSYTIPKSTRSSKRTAGISAPSAAGSIATRL